MTAAVSDAGRLVPLSEVGADARRRWEALAGVAAEPSPFAERGFVEAATTALGGRDVRLLTAHGPDGVDLVLPVHRTRLRRRTPVPVLSTWRHDYCFHGAPLVRAGREADAWTTALRSLRDSRPAALLLLPQLWSDGAVRAGLRAAVRDLGLPAVTVRREPRAVAWRREDGSYFDHLRGVHRKGLRRQRRMLGSAAGGQVVCVDRSGDPAAVEAFLTLEAAGWKGRQGTAMATRGHDAELVRELVRHWGDRVLVHLLEVQGRAVAAQLTLVAGDALFAFKTTYDEQYASSSPGLLLMMDVVETFHRTGRSLLDSCAVPGHPMADRLFVDRRSTETVLVALGLVGAGLLRAIAPGRTSVLGPVCREESP